MLGFGRKGKTPLSFVFFPTWRVWCAISQEGDGLDYIVLYVGQVHMYAHRLNACNTPTKQRCGGCISRKIPFLRQGFNEIMIIFRRGKALAKTMPGQGGRCVGL